MRPLSMRLPKNFQPANEELENEKEELRRIPVGTSKNFNPSFSATLETKKKKQKYCLEHEKETNG
jgi:hypothetical protein